MRGEAKIMRRIGIIGFPGSGKSLIFCILACPGGSSEHVPGQKAAPRIVDVPDSRLARLGELFSPPKLIHARLEFLEIAVQKKHGGGQAPDYSAGKEMDGLLYVLRGFLDKNPGEPENNTGALNDFNNLETELMLADLEAVDARLEKVGLEEKRGREIGKEEKVLLERCRSSLEKEIPLRALKLTSDGKKTISGFQFLSLKPTVAVVNIDERCIGEKIDENLKNRCRNAEVEIAQLSAPVELEVNQLGDSEREEFLSGFGIKEAGRGKLIRAVFEALDLISFFTIGEKEIRAWMIEKGSTALSAAGKVHTDMERGFIRAEVINFEEFAVIGSFEKARQEGKLRLEGKDYPVGDGDIIRFRFSV